MKKHLFLVMLVLAIFMVVFISCDNDISSATNSDYDSNVNSDTSIDTNTTVDTNISSDTNIDTSKPNPDTDTDIGTPDNSDVAYEFNYELLDDGTYAISKGKSTVPLSIEIPMEYEGKTVTKIADHGFEGCVFINIKIPQTIKAIGKGAFDDCTTVKKVDFIGSAAKWCQIEFDDSGSNPLFYAKKLYINGELLEHIDATRNVDKISDYAFISSTVKSINIGKSVKSIGRMAFYGCESLNDVQIATGIEAISSGAFYNCTSLTSIDIPNSVVTLGAQAFYGCTNLEEVYLSDNITSVGLYAFKACKALTKIEIPSKATEIGAYAFSKCISLAELSFSNSVKTIGENAFDDCNALKKVNYFGSIEEWCKIVFANSYSNPLSSFACLYVNDILLEELVIPNTITQINDYAFYCCAYLLKVSGGENVKIIGKNSFRYCAALTEATIGNSVTKIDDEAFAFCLKLKKLSIGNSVEEIGSQAFRGCESLTEVNIPNSIKKIGKCAFMSCNRMKTVTIGNNIEEICEEAFASCHSMTDLTIGASLKTLGLNAFVTCQDLKNINYLGTVENWCNITFFGPYASPVAYAKSLSINGELLTDLVIPSSVTSINKYAFMDCQSLKTITIPSSVKQIDDYAFSGCGNIDTLEISYELEEMGAFVFSGCQIKNAYIPYMVYQNMSNATIENLVLQIEPTGDNE